MKRFYVKEVAQACGISPDAVRYYVQVGLLTPKREAALFQECGRQYVSYINHTYRRRGTLWEGRHKGIIVESALYLLACMRYIELNPVRAGIVARPEHYRWSSYAANALGEDNCIESAR